MPSTLGRFGFTGKTAPPKGELIRFQSVVRPTLPTFSVAPMTAILRGEKKCWGGSASCLKISWADSGLAAVSGFMDRVTSRIILDKDPNTLLSRRMDPCRG